jgi:hypothetical protein
VTPYAGLGVQLIGTIGLGQHAQGYVAICLVKTVPSGNVTL